MTTARTPETFAKMIEQDKAAENTLEHQLSWFVETYRQRLSSNCNYVDVNSLMEGFHGILLDINNEIRRELYLRKDGKYVEVGLTQSGERETTFDIDIHGVVIRYNPNNCINSIWNNLENKLNERQRAIARIEAMHKVLSS